jgi:Transcriptional regulators of sugar metabolism
MFINEEDFNAWMKRIMSRFDKQDKILEKMNSPKKILEEEALLDNQDLCELLHVSKRTLQRYRDSGELQFQTLYHKTFYKKSDVLAFIKMNFDKKDREDNNDDHE